MSALPALTLEDGSSLPVLYEDRSVIGIDKPAGWMLAPDGWDRTGRNLQLALEYAIASKALWARSRGIRFLRFVHRLDAPTTGVLLLAKSLGVLRSISTLFRERRVEKRYLAVVHGSPKCAAWVNRHRVGPVSGRPGKMRIDASHGQLAETEFRAIASQGGLSLVEAIPFTGRTHQIRVHLLDSGLPIVGDELYGRTSSKGKFGLRAVLLAYRDPFRNAPVEIRASTSEFVQGFGFPPKVYDAPPARAGGETANKRSESI